MPVVEARPRGTSPSSMPWWRSRRTRRASASSSVATAPPSPVVTTLRGCSEKHARSPDAPAGRPPAREPERPGRVLDDVQAVRAGELQDRRHLHRIAEQVHDAERLGARRDGGRELLRAGDVGPRRHVAEDRRRAAEERGAGRRGEGVRGHHDLVARPDVEREVGQVQRRGAVRAADREGRSGGGRHRPLVLREHRPEREVAAGEHALHRGQLRLAQVGPREAHPRHVAHVAPEPARVPARACAPAPRRGRPAAPRTGARATS